MRISDWSSDVCSSDLNGRNIDGSLRLAPLASRLRIFGQQERNGCRSGIRSRHGGRRNMSELATIGYEGAALAEVIATLQAADIRLVIDVRALPISRDRNVVVQGTRGTVAGESRGRRGITTKNK